MTKGKSTLDATYFLELIFLQAFEFERHIEDPNLQVDTLLKASSAKTKARKFAFVAASSASMARTAIVI